MKTFILLTSFLAAVSVSSTGFALDRETNTVSTSCKAAADKYFNYMFKATRGDRPGIGAGDSVVTAQLEAACNAACGVSKSSSESICSYASNGAQKRVYMCEYDGGLDAFTWQATGEVAVPPPGAAICTQPDGYRCDQVIDSNGGQLGGYPGRGSYCGSDSTSQGDYPGIKAYEQ